MSLLDSIAERAKSAWKTGWQYAGQLPAGAAEMTIANADTPALAKRRAETKAALRNAGGLTSVAQWMRDHDPTNIENYDYTPAIAAQPGAIANLVQQGLHYVAPSYVDAPAKDSFTQTSADAAITASERTNETLGIQAPQNAFQLGTRIIGSLLVPSPIKTPPITAATRVGKVLQGARNLAIETAVPMRQSKLASPITAIVPAVGTAAVEAIDKFGTPLPGYSNITELGGDKQSDQTPSTLVAGGGGAAPTGEPDLFGNSAVAEFDASQAQDVLGDSAVAQHDAQQGAPVADPLGEHAVAQYDTGIPPVPKADDEDWSNWEIGALAVGSLAAFSATVGVTRAVFDKLAGGGPVAGDLGGRIVTSPRPIEFAPDNKFKGLVPKVVQRGIKKVDQTIAQHDAAPRSVANEFLTADQAARTGFNLDLVVPQALGAKAKNTLLTGAYPGTTVQGEAAATVLQAIATDLTPVERAMLRDGLLAATALDDIAHQGMIPARRPTFTATQITELQAKANAIMTDPKLSKYAIAIRRQYETLLKYKQASGFIDATAAADLRAKRPNYVHLSKDTLRRGAADIENTAAGTGAKTDDMLARSVEDWEGVQTGGARDPIDDLPEQITKAIQAAETNNLKRQLFDELMNSRAATATVTKSDGSTAPLIMRYPPGSIPNDMTGVHTIWDNGRALYYKIGDPALDNALQFNPRATMPYLGQMRQINQFFTTGLGNISAMFGATVSPVYDTLAGMVLKPGGMDIGLINEMFNKAGVGRGGPIGEFARRFDPTILFTAPIGAIRSAYDEFTGSMANNLSTILMRDNGLIIDLVGAGKLTALRDVLKSHYDTSLRSMLDEAGVSSHFAYGADDTSRVPIGLKEVAPDFYAQTVSREAMLARQSMLDGTWGGFVDGVLANSKNAFVQAANRLPGGGILSKMYKGVVRNMQEGFRYQYAATNLPKTATAQQFHELMANTRRISSDPGQYGGGKAWNQAADSLVYMNVGTQSLAEFARKFASNPKVIATNLLVTISTLMAIRYGGMISDPDIKEKVKNSTDAQNTTRIIGPGGVTIPIEQGMQLITGPLFAYIDALAMDKDGNFDPNFANAIYNYYDVANTEHRDESLSNSFFAAMHNASPASLGSLPLGNAVLSLNGVDPGTTRATGEPSPIREQDSRQMGGTGKITDSLISAQWGAVLDSSVGSSVTNFISIADQAQRAFLAQNADGSRGASPATAAKIGLSQFAENVSKSKGPPQGLLFNDYEKVNSIATTDYTLFQKKQDGVEKAVSIFGEQRNKFKTSSDPRIALQRPMDLVPQELWGTQLAYIGSQALILDKYLDQYNKMGAQVTEQIEEVKNQKTSTIEQRNEQVNKLIDRRKHFYSLMLVRTRQSEELIGRQLGEEGFNFQTFDPEKYKKPMPAGAPPAAPGAAPPGMPPAQAAPSGQ